MVHVISQKIDTLPETTESHRIDIHALHLIPSVPGILQTSAKLTVSERITLIGQLPAVCRFHLLQIFSDRGIIPDSGEKVVSGWRKFLRTLLPGSAAVTTKQRQHLIHGNFCPAGAVPARHRIKRHFHPTFYRQLFQLFQIFRVIGHLIFQLDRQNGTAVLKVEAIQLFCHDPVPAFHFLHKPRISIPKRKRLFQKPVRETAVPQFSVDPGSDPHRSLHPQFPDKRYKGTQIILSLKVENAFLFLVAEPGHIGRHQFNASGLHL